jgi:hypothetical protein
MTEIKKTVERQNPLSGNLSNKMGDTDIFTDSRLNRRAELATDNPASFIMPDAKTPDKVTQASQTTRGGQ